MKNAMNSMPVQVIRDAAHRIEGVATDYDPLMDLVGDARFVLLGEASHGTHDFYDARAKITKRSRLIRALLPQLPIGIRRRRKNAYVRDWREVMKRSSMLRISHVFCLSCVIKGLYDKHYASRVSNEPLALFIVLKRND